MTADKWLVADEWFAEFIRDLEAHAGRVTRLRREAGRGITRAYRDAAEFDLQTENYVKYLRMEEGQPHGW